MIYFYNVSNLLNPIEILKYNIKSNVLKKGNRSDYSHGICLVNFNKLSNKNAFNIQFITFGNWGVNYQRNVLLFSFVISHDFCEIDSMKDEIIKNAPINKLPPRNYFSCISNCLFNKKNERMVFLIYFQSIYIYNIDFNIVIMKENV